MKTQARTTRTDSFSKSPECFSSQSKANQAGHASIVRWTSVHKRAVPTHILPVLYVRFPRDCFEQFPHRWGLFRAVPAQVGSTKHSIRRRDSIAGTTFVGRYSEALVFVGWLNTGLGRLISLILPNTESLRVYTSMSGAQQRWFINTSQMCSMQ